MPLTDLQTDGAINSRALNVLLTLKAYYLGRYTALRMWIDSVREFILNYSWLSTPIIAAIGWFQTWVIASLFLSIGKSNEVVEAIEESRLQSSFVRYYNEDREDPGVTETSTCNYVAEQRYTGE